MHVRQRGYRLLQRVTPVIGQQPWHVARHQRPMHSAWQPLEIGDAIRDEREHTAGVEGVMRLNCLQRVRQCVLVRLCRRPSQRQRRERREHRTEAHQHAVHRLRRRDVVADVELHIRQCHRPRLRHAPRLPGQRPHQAERCRGSGPPRAELERPPPADRPPRERCRSLIRQPWPRPCAPGRWMSAWTDAGRIMRSVASKSPMSSSPPRVIGPREAPIAGALHPKTAALRTCKERVRPARQGSAHRRASSRRCMFGTPRYGR